MRTADRKIIGYIFILVGLLINEVIIALFFKGWYAPYRVDFLLRLTIFSLQGSLVSIGWLIIKGRTLSWFLDLYRGLALFVFNVILLVALFLGEIAFRNKLDYINFLDGKVLSNHHALKEKPELMKAVYPSLSKKEIREIILSPNLTSHPTLEFMSTPIRSKFYNVGFENMRYSSAVNEDNASSSINGSTWVFGGSTVFGSGVSDNETIPAYLNRFGATEDTFINFGVYGYMLNNEIEKLILLLKKGWRPKRVIFLDGLNDTAVLPRAHFHPTETPTINPFGAGFSIFNFGSVLGLIKTAVQRRFPPDSELLYPENGFEDIYKKESPYHKYPVAFYNFFLKPPYKNLNDVANHPKRYMKKLETYYRLNLEFIKHLGKSFGFDFYVFFQPFGPLSLKNPFIENVQAYKNWSYYKAFYAIVPLFREHLKHNPISRFYDISDADSECPQCYVDLTHYNPGLNAIIAQRILKQLDSLEKDG